MTKLFDLGLKFGDRLLKIQKADGHLQATLGVVVARGYGLAGRGARQHARAGAGPVQCASAAAGAASA
jgi:hypothetical protein